MKRLVLLLVSIGSISFLSPYELVMIRLWALQNNVNQENPTLVLTPVHILYRSRCKIWAFLIWYMYFVFPILVGAGERLHKTTPNWCPLRFIHPKWILRIPQWVFVTKKQKKVRYPCHLQHTKSHVIIAIQQSWLKCSNLVYATCICLPENSLVIPRKKKKKELNV